MEGAKAPRVKNGSTSKYDWGERRPVQVWSGVKRARHSGWRPGRGSRGFRYIGVWPSWRLRISPTQAGRPSLSPEKEAPTEFAVSRRVVPSALMTDAA